MKTALRLAALLALAAASWASDWQLEKALRVDAFLGRIAAPRPPSVFLKRAAFSEGELNSYLNLVYAKKYAPEISFIQLRLQDENRVDGSLKLKLDAKKYAAVPAFLRETEVRFRGAFETAHQRMRFVFSELAINGARFAPDALDEVFAAAQAGAKAKRSLFDWFTLLPGLKGVQSSEKTIFFLY
jgi:hypothetical protein